MACIQCTMVQDMCTMVYHCLPWYTTVHHGIPLFIMVYHGCTMIPFHKGVHCGHLTGLVAQYNKTEEKILIIIFTE